MQLYTIPGFEHYETATESVIAEYNRLEKSIARNIETYLILSAGVYLDYDFTKTAACHCMSRDNTYVKDYASEIAYKVYKFDYNPDTETEEFMEDPLTWHRLLKIERKLENLFDARENLWDKYGSDVFLQEKNA